MLAIFPALLPFGAFIAALLWGQSMNKKRVAAWSAVAQHLGLGFHAGSGIAARPVIDGVTRGVAQRIEIHKPSGNNSAVFTQYTLRYPSQEKAAVMFRKQTPFTIFSRLVGRADVEIGDPVFDQKVAIDSADPVAVARYLTPSRRMALLTMFETWHIVEVTPGSINVRLQGFLHDEEMLISTATRLVDLALVMSAPSSVDIALEQQARGDLSDAVQALHQINDVQDAPPNSFTQLLEAEALVAMGEGQRAKEVIDTIEVSDPELDSWREVARSHPIPVDALEQSPESTDPSLEPTPPVTLDQESVITDLFGSNRLGHDVEKRFFEAYEGATIEWSGTVERFREFRSDSDFAGSGIKANVLIGNRGDGRLISDQIQAIVHLPEGTVIERGQTVAFRGTFKRVDRYMRNLFVSNGIVV